jgi:hypothetical protein
VSHDPDLALHALGLVGISQQCLVHNLDGHFASAQVMDSQTHLQVVGGAILGAVQSSVYQVQVAQRAVPCSGNQT